jgi:7-cyano-7-deazaguanine reductase
MIYKDIKKELLKAIENPDKNDYEIKIKIPEFTFLGVKDQPDFADVYITMFPDKKVVELKSLKKYCQQLRNIIVSYERLVNVFYEHLEEVYEPKKLIVSMIFNARGGISSKLTRNSGWGNETDIIADNNVW